MDDDLALIWQGIQLTVGDDHHPVVIPRVRGCDLRKRKIRQDQLTYAYKPRVVIEDPILAARTKAYNENRAKKRLLNRMKDLVHTHNNKVDDDRTADSRVSNTDLDSLSAKLMINEAPELAGKRLS